MKLLRPRALHVLTITVACTAAAPAGTALAAKASQPTFPVIKLVSPLKLGIGDMLTIEGRGFVAGKNKNTVVFQRDGQRVVFVKAESATKTVIKLHVPVKIQAYLEVTDGKPQLTRFRLRVISKRFGKAYTSLKLSPQIGLPGVTAAPPSGDGAGTGGATGGGGTATTAPPEKSAYEKCLDAAGANIIGDEDGDSLLNGREKEIGTDPCRNDSDTDGMADGWEYQSAIDLNSRALPYPGKRPWPNPLDPTDGGYDFDGDGLFSAQEYDLWKTAGSHFAPDATIPAYSDGTQNTGGTVPAITPEQQQLDLDRDGNLTDDERDFDADGLSNWVEFNGRGTYNWWKDVWTDEKPYAWRAFDDPDPIVADTDGDGLLDGADDQDQDGWTNIQEMEYSRWQIAYRVQPFNPCLPDVYSRTCGRYVPIGSDAAWPPFDGTEPYYQPADADHGAVDGAAVPFTWPLPSLTVPGGGWTGASGPQGP